MIRFLTAAFIFALSSFADVTKGEFGAAQSEKIPAKTTPPARAREDKPNVPGEKAKATSYPFHGTLDSADPAGNVIILRGKARNRVILVTSRTRIFRDSNYAELTDAVPGERVTGSVRKNHEGKEEALTVRLGSKPRQ